MKAIVAAALATAAGMPAHAACTIARIAELPVTMTGLRPMVEAQIDGHPVRFLADSGAFFSLITPGTAAELKLSSQPAPIGFALRGVGGEAEARVTTVQSFTIAGHALPRMTFIVAGSEVGGEAGLLGQNFLGLRDAGYDLAGGVIRLMDAHDCAHSSLAYWAAGKPVAEVPLEDLDRRNAHIMGQVKVNGIKMRAMFDTGASTSSLTVAAAARAGVHVNDPGVRAAGYSTGIGRKGVRNWIAPFASFEVGGEEVRNTRLRIAELGGDFDMLVGADFFLSHRAYVANGLHRLYLTYNGGPVFNLTAGGGAEAPLDGAPAIVAATDGAAAPGELARRGAAMAARRDYAAALAAFDQAVAGAPDDADLRLQRARAHLALRQPLLAAGDLDQAISLKPDLIDARLTRAELRLHANDRAGAREDVDAAAAAAAAGPADVHLALGEMYDVLNAPDEAIRQLDLWITAHPDDARRPVALNSRCWSRALAGQDLAKALGDSNAALRARPGAASFHDSRGLVRLRMGDLAGAIEDYDAALATAPKMAWPRYGKGLAEVAQGRTAEGQADIAAATAIERGLPARARRFGIAPRS